MTGLIINADDYGMSLSINNAIDNLSKYGCLSSTSLMTNMPYVESITRLIQQVPDIGVGVHLTLSQGSPISPLHEVLSLVDERGEFLSYQQFIRKLLKGRISLKECKLELKRQIIRAKELTNDSIDHWNSHHGIHRFEPLLSVFINICREMEVPAMRSHKHYWISSNSPKWHLSPSRPGGGLRSKFIETYYLWMRWRSGRYYAFPKGIIALTDLNQIYELINEKSKWKGVFEIVCHPATSVSGLVQTDLLDKRIKEYEDLAKKEIVDILLKKKKTNFLMTFRDLLF